MAAPVRKTRRAKKRRLTRKDMKELSALFYELSCDPKARKRIDKLVKKHAKP